MIKVNLKEFKQALKEVEKNKMVGVTDVIITCKGDNTIEVIKNNISYEDRLNNCLKKKITCDNPEGLELNIVLNKTTIKLINKLKDEYIALDNEFIVSGSKKKITFKNDFSKDMIVSHEDEVVNNVEITQGELLRVLTVDYAVSKEEYKPTLNNVYFDYDNIVAIDGYRIAKRKCSVNFNHSFMIYKDNIKILKSLLKDNDSIVKCSIEKKYIVFNIDNLEFIAYYDLDNTMIKYKNLTNIKDITNFNIKYEVGLKDLLEISDMTKVYKEKPIMMFKHTSDNKLTVVGRSLDNKDDTISITFDNSHTESETIENEDGKDTDIVLNDNYIYDVLKNMSSSTEKIKMYSNSCVSPMYIIPEGETSFNNIDLILPIRC